MKQHSRDVVMSELNKLKPQLEHLYGVTKIGIFGSLARNEQHADSDIDVVIEMRQPDLFYMVHIKELLETHFKQSVDIVRYRPMMNQHLKTRIDRDAVYV